jgi:S1-C subfamily serine protease
MGELQCRKCSVVNDDFTLKIIGGVLAACAVAAMIHEIIRQHRSTETKSYWWGLFVGYSAIAVGLAAFLIYSMLLWDSWADWKAMEPNLVACVWAIAMCASGIGILLRRKWAWITRICLWPNIVTIIINVIYYKNRREEFDAEAKKRKASNTTADTSTKEEAEGAGASRRQDGKWGVAALWAAGGAALALVATTVGSAMLLAGDPAALGEDRPATILVGFIVLLVGAGVLAAVGLGITSLLRGERKRWPAITAIIVAVISCVFAVAGVLADDSAGPGQQADGMTTGTGFYVTGNGYLITCRHVIGKGNNLSVLTSQGTAPAELVAVHSLLDLALLKVNADTTYLPIGKSGELPLGAAVATLGFPNIEVQGFEPKLTKGHVAALSGPQDDPAYLQLGMPIAPGYSGSAVIDDDGNAVGVATMILDERVAANVSYATKGELVFLFLVDAAKRMNLSDLNPPRSNGPGSGTNMDKVRDATVLVIADAEE